MEKYIIQKSQKIVSALYIITDSIKDSDVIKWEIREEGISLVSNALMFNTNFTHERDHATRLFLSTSDKLISFLNICLIASLISQMNASIVIQEIESLVSFIKRESKENLPPGYILSDTFFGTEIEEKKDIKDIKGQDNLLKTYQGEKALNASKKAKNEDRKEGIIAILKKDSNLTIKDFTKVIKNCSEKTIQRDLIVLVKKGIVKKVGERRWSTYSLA